MSTLIQCLKKRVSSWKVEEVLAWVVAVGAFYFHAYYMGVEAQNMANQAYTNGVRNQYNWSKPTIDMQAQEIVRLKRECNK